MESNIKSKSKSTLGKDALKLTTSKLMATMISLLTVMLLSRFLTLEEYGTYSQIVLVANLFTALFMLGLPNSINFFLARAESNEERQRFLSVYYTFSTILSFFVGLFLVLAAPLIVEYFNNTLLSRFIYFLAFYPWAKIVMSSIESVLIVYKRASLIIVYRLMNSISLLLIILFVQVFSLDFKMYMLLFILVESIFALSVYLIVKSLSGKLKISFEKSLIKKILFFSIPIGLASAVGTLNIALDKLMIGRFLDTEHLAVYTNASRELPFAIVATSLTAVLLPQLARLLKKGETKVAVDLWGNTTTLSYIIICFLGTGVFVFAPEVMTLLYSDKFLSGIDIFRIYCLTLFLKCTYFGIILNSIGKTRFILYSSIISICLNAILNYIFIYTIGFEGPAIATFLSQLFINIIQLVFTAKVIGISFSKVFPWRSLGLITLVNFVFGYLFFHLKGVILLDELVGEIIESILLGVLWGVLYLIIFINKMKQQWKAINK